MYINKNTMMSQDVRRMLGMEKAKKTEEKKTDGAKDSLENSAAVLASEEMLDSSTENKEAAAVSMDDIVVDKVDVSAPKKTPQKQLFDYMEAKKLAEEARQEILANPDGAMRAQGNTPNETAWKLLA